MSRRQFGAVAAVGMVGALSLVTASTATATQPASSAQSLQLVADFNNDGYADLVVGVPGENLPGANNAGAVNVIYGSAAGLRSAGNQLWTQNSPGIAGVAEAGDQFGYSVAAEDFNGDGYTDLAVGVPFEDLAHRDDGAVNVIYGSPTGLRAAGNQLWTQNSPGIAGVAEAGDRFGYSLAAANLGHGLRSPADLAIGVPYEDQAGTNDGAVNVIYGSTSGLTRVGNQVWWQNSPGIAGVAESGDLFGYSLAAANLGRNGYADLAVGVPYEDQAGTNDGAVNVIYGSFSGLTRVGNQVWWQNSPGIAGVAESGDLFGYSLAAANLGRNGYADLAVGVPYEDQAGTNDGAVNVIYGSFSGLTRVGNQVWWQNSPGIAGVAESGDLFGYSLAAANLGRNGYADLAVGVPYEDQAGTNDGAVNVIYGSFSGLTRVGNQVWWQNSPGIAGVAETGDYFGLSLAAANFGKGRYADLAVGVPYEDQAGTNDGAVNVIYGSFSGLTRVGNQVWWQNSPGIAGVAQQGDMFGRAVGARHP